MNRIWVGTLLCLITVSGPAWAQEVGSVAIHGFASQGYMRGFENSFLAGTERGSFEFNEFAINFRTEPVEDLSFGLQIAAMDLGSVGNGNPFIDWAFLRYRLEDWLIFSAGRLKNNIGLYGASIDIDAGRTSILLPDGVYPFLTRDALIATNGIGIEGNLFFESIGGLSYSAVLGANNVDSRGGTARSFELLGLVDPIEEAEVPTSANGQIAWSTPIDGLRLVQSLVHLDIILRGDAASEFVDLLAAVDVSSTSQLRLRDLITSISSIEWAGESLTLSAEYQRTWYELAGSFISREVEQEFFYGMAVYQLTDQLRVGAYYGFGTEDVGDRFGDAYAESTGLAAHRRYKHQFTASIRFDPLPFWSVKAEGHGFIGSMGVDPTENPDGIARQWGLLALKTTVFF